MVLRLWLEICESIASGICMGKTPLFSAFYCHNLKRNCLLENLVEVDTLDAHLDDEYCKLASEVVLYIMLSWELQPHFFQNRLHLVGTCKSCLVLIILTSIRKLEPKNLFMQEAHQDMLMFERVQVTASLVCQQNTRLSNQGDEMSTKVFNGFVHNDSRGT
ncbi:unnamed protein product [Lupinus luteus]|uniref:Uncharacterized protein n=1 Tax=Lupinus luteus TaxID=3873 RepID=A0AAV1VS07_LUPLU